MSEVIENYIRRHAEVPEAEAFEGFLRDERIRRWVGEDEGRRDRLRREFSKVYASLGQGASAPQVAQQVPPPHGRSGPAGPTAAATAPRPLRVEVHAPAHAAPEGFARQLQLLCRDCAKYDVWLQGGTIQCRRCGREYDDMLSLIPVKPIGPFAFVFGEGWVGYVTAGGLAAGLGFLYYLVRYALR